MTPSSLDGSSGSSGGGSVRHEVPPLRVWALTDRVTGAMFERSDPSTGRLLVRVTRGAFHDAPKGVLRMHAGTKRLERSPPH